MSQNRSRSLQPSCAPDRARPSRRVLPPGTVGILALGLAGALGLACSDGSASDSRDPFATGPGSPLEESPAYAAYQSGMELARQGLFERAAEEFDRGLSLDPFQSELYYELSNALDELGADQALELTLTRGLQISPEHAGLQGNMGAFLARTRKPQKAVKRFRQSLDVDPNQPEVQFMMGRTLVYLSDAKMGARTINREKLDEGVGHLATAVELDRENAEYRVWYGMALERQNNVDLARQQFEKAIEIDPENGQAHKKLGILLVNEGRVAEARTALDRALEVIPEDDELNFQYGVLCEQEGELERAREFYERAVELKPSNHEPHFRLGTVLQRLGEDDLAAYHLEEADHWSRLKDQLMFWHTEVKKRPDDSEALMKLGEVHYLLLDPVEALAWFSRSQESDPKNAMAIAYTGVIFHEEGELDGAIVALTHAYGIEPENPFILESLARVYEDKEDFEKARELLDELVKLAPEDPDSYYELAKLHILSKDYDGAKGVLERCIELDETYIDARFALGGILYDREEYEQAAENFRRVLEIDPMHPEARYYLTLTEAKLSGSEDKG